MTKKSNKICKAINTKGKKCRVPAVKGSGYCFRHKNNKGYSLNRHDSRSEEALCKRDI